MKRFDGILHLKKCGSTQDRIKDINRSGWFLLYSDRQKRGYGRSGDRWASQEGGLYYSIQYPLHALDVPLPLQLMGTMYLWLRILSKNFTDGLVELKWPNDLLLDKKKVGGVLGDKNGKHVYIGIGINVNNTFRSPENFDYQPTSLYLTENQKFLPAQLLFTWVRKFLDECSQPEDSIFDPQKIAEETVTIGKKIIYETQTGTAVGLDSNGGLLFKSDRKVESIYSADSIEVLDT